MGIRMLNRFLQEQCVPAITTVGLEELEGKKIAVDISIYLYKYLSENALLENLYLMISLFRHYNIIPIFIFDGKPPVEKQDTLIQRKIVKKNAKDEYYKLKKLLADADKVDNKEILDLSNNLIEEISKSLDRVEIERTMEKLKKRFIALSPENIQNVKTLLQSYGVTYFEAPGEADILCAKLVAKKMVYACLSEDTDMFVYGCTRVLRYLSLTSSTVIMYDFAKICNILDVDGNEFRQCCILSGTDYNMKEKEEKDENKLVEFTNEIQKQKSNKKVPDLNIYNVFKLFKRYRESVGRKTPTKKKTEMDFYAWVEKTGDYNINIIDLYNINNLFNISNYDCLKIYDKIKIMNGPIDRDRLIKIMELEYFIFMPSK